MQKVLSSGTYQKFIHSHVVQVAFLLQKVMSKELKKVKKWLDANQLALNIDKTNFVIFHSRQKKITEQIIIIKFMKKKIERNTSVKFLGVLLDSNLSWKSHITELSKKTVQNNWIFL